MADLVRRPRARRDLLAIWDFISDHKEAAADDVLEWIEDALIMLAENPLAGPAKPELTAALRSFPVGSYLIANQSLFDRFDRFHTLHVSLGPRGGTRDDVKRYPCPYQINQRNRSDRL